jgi:uncharacterized damage-inducible protein DinB
MRRALICSLAVTLLAGALAAAQYAQPNTKHPLNDSNRPAAAPAGGEAPAGSLRAFALHQITGAEKHLVALAEAMPADKYGWRPGEGVRSVGEVYMHVASANYWLPTFWGAKVPAGVDPRSLEKDGADKAKTVAALKQSFEFVHQAIDALPEADLSKAIKIFGRDAMVGDALLGIASHAHEHLGQAIAYARMNSIVPPWSAAEGQRGR